MIKGVQALPAKPDINSVCCFFGYGTHHLGTAVGNMGDGLDLKFYVYLIRRRFMYFLLPLLLTLAAGTAIVFSLPKIYNSSAKILVESQQIPDALVKATVTTLATERVQVIQTRVLTRENLLKLIDKFTLFETRKDLSKSEIVDLMRSRISFVMLDLGIGQKKNKKDDRLTVAFSIGFDYERPDSAAKVANELVTIVLEEDIRNRKDAASESTKFLSQESEKLLTELANLDANISEYKIKNSDLLPEKLAFNMAQMERLEKSIDELDKTKAVAEDGVRQMELEASARRVSPIQTDRGKPQAGGFQQEMEALQAKFAQVSAVLTANHPDMRSLQRQISALQKKIDTENASMANAKPLQADDPNLSLELRLMAERINSLKLAIAQNARRRLDIVASVEELKKVITATPSVGANLESMLRKRSALQTSTDDLASKLAQARMGERLEAELYAERFEVIEAPIVPTEPDRPKRAQLLLLVAAAALGLGGATSFAAEYFDGAIRRAEVITQNSKSRLLVSIPYIQSRLENRRDRSKMLLYILLALLAIIAVLSAIHFLYLPLDLLYQRALGKLRF
jgi:polysaccharide biosynthesis transport protein